MQSHIIKTRNELNIIRENGKRHHSLTQAVRKFIKKGVSTYEIEDYSRRLMKKLSLEPIQIGYQGYPAATCIGINNDGLHCIPQKNKIIKEGDLVTFDTAVKHNGYCVDAGFSLGIGEIDSKGKKLISINKQALYKAAEMCREDIRVGDIGYTVSTIIKKAGFDVLKTYVGHGIGRNMHEEPQIPNYGIRGKGIKLQKGMVLALDTMVAEGKGILVLQDDGWSTKMKDGKRLSYYEHTVIVGKNKGEIIT